jgi:E3 ubiquitin-protein ligase MYCBP2
MSQGRSWNTGNGSPDAICLTVDKPGVVLVGFCVYGGGGIHEYELEVLADDVRVFLYIKSNFKSNVFI